VVAHLRDSCEPREFSSRWCERTVVAVAVDFAEESFFRQEEEDLQWWPSLRYSNAARVLR
jgi:hypothetical protein